jgi:hypothetical protein
MRTFGGRNVGAVAELGTNAIPFLTKALKRRDVIPYTWRVKGWRMLPKSLQTKFSKFSPDVPASTFRQNALFALRGFGPEARSALPAVIAAARSDSDILNRSFALQAAVAIDPEDPRVIQLLEAGLRSSDPMKNSEAAGALYCNAVFPRILTNFVTLNPTDPNKSYLNELLALEPLGPDAAPMVSRILRFLDSDPPGANALTALRHVGPGGSNAIPSLIKCLEWDQPHLQTGAAAALMSMQSVASNAVPTLEKVMREGNQVPRVMAAAARWRITGDTSPSMAVILDVLKAKADNSFWALGQRQFGLENFGFGSRETALWIAGDFGPEAREALPLLEKQMEKGSEWYRIIAARSIWKIDGSAQGLPVLKAGLTNNAEHIRALSCYIAGEMGAVAAPLLPDLDAASYTTLVTRRAALDALNAIRQNSRTNSALPNPK